MLASPPPPPTDPSEFQKWAQNLAELSEQRGEGRGEGKGLLAGEMKGRVADILMVLQERGLRVPKEVERRIVSCTDPETLWRWLKRAVTVIEAVEVVTA